MKKTAMTSHHGGAAALMLALLLALSLPATAQSSGAVAAQPDTTRAERTRTRWTTKREHLKQQAKEQKERLRVKAKEQKEKLKVKSEQLKVKGMEVKVQADSILDIRNARVTTDTLWVARPQCTWTLRAKTDMIGDIIHLHTGDESGHPSDYYMTARPKMTLGVSANYRGISLALSFSPTKLLSDISDMLSSFNYYSNQFGGDLTMEKIDEFDGRTGLVGKSRRLSNTNLRSFTASGYYVFNGKRFSYPAVFNSTWEQKRSAGSLIAQANLNWGRLNMGNPEEMNAGAYTDVLHRINMRSFSIGIGYGYNLVMPPHWLIHLTLQPSIMLWKNYTLHLTDHNLGNSYTDKMPSGSINIHLTGRAGATYSWDKYFIGATGVFHTIKTGKQTDISITDTKWKARAFFGIRL